MLVGSNQALAVPPKPTGAVAEVCGEAWPGHSQPAKACAILWWNASTHELSAHCIVEYSYSGVTTNVHWCILQQSKGRGKRRTVETVAAIVPGNSDTSNADQTYTFSTAAVAWVKKDTYSVGFNFQPSEGTNATGPDVQLAMPFVKERA
jgi:hypothetical protein